MVANFVENFRYDIRIYWLGLCVQFNAAAALRGAFVMQIVGMMLNNTVLIAAWLFMFGYFGTINGWGGYELIGLQGLNMLIFGIVVLGSGGLASDFSKQVDQGSFDNFLTRPASVLSQVASSSIDISAVGDVLLGLGLAIWYMVHIHAGLTASVLFLVAIAEGCILFWCFFAALPSLLAFYVFDSDRLVRYLGGLFVDTGMYPTGVLSGTLRTMLLLVVPGLFIGAVQIDILRNLHWELVAIGGCLALFWLVVSLWLFKRSIRRYESSNLIGAR
jgi:ABC-2 type transport system permease protein